MIHIGIPTLIETKSIEDCARLCKKFGFQFIELNMNMPQYQIENIDIQKFSEVAKKNGIYFTIHLDENLNVCDFNKKVASAYIETVLATIGLAKKLDVSILNMHLSKGVYFTLPQHKVYLFSEYIDTYLSSLESFRDKCEQAIGDANIKICIENSDGYDQDFLIKGLTFLLKSKVFGLTYDIGHNAGIGGDDEAVILGHESKLGRNIVVGSHGTALSTIINYYNPDFGYEGFWSIADKMPYILCFKFKNMEFVSMEEVEL